MPRVGSLDVNRGRSMPPPLTRCQSAHGRHTDVEGHTLAEHLRNGRLAVDEALQIARQIAEALDTAHEHGIVYRDLKPANIKVGATSDESGRPEVYVRPLPSRASRFQVSTDGGGQPVWSRHGKELFYRSRTHVMAAAVTSRDPIVFATPMALFPDRFEHPQENCRGPALSRPIPLACNAMP